MQIKNKIALKFISNITFKIPEIIIYYIHAISQSSFNSRFCVDFPVDSGVGIGAAENHFFDGDSNIAQNFFDGNFCRLFCGDRETPVLEN